jgi:V/A-type H+-transporting ATPase subunit C
MGEKIYPYAVARIRMLERSLLTEKNYTQMAEAKNADEALKVLIEAGYGEGFNVEAKNFENLLSKQLSKAYADVRELVADENFMDVFLYKNDYHNIKVLIKSDISGVDPSPYIIDGGTVDADVLKTAFATKNYNTIPYYMHEAINAAYEAYGRTQSGQSIDIVLDKAAFKQMNMTAGESGSDFIKKYVEYVCDITNIKSFFRMKNMKKTFETFAECYVEGGSLSLDLFKAAYNGETPWGGLRGTQYYDMCAEGMPKGFTVFERLCDNFIMSFIKEAKYKSLTMEPMAAYIYAKETEVKTVRIIMSGKLNGIDADTIKERLRDAYV